MIEGEKRVGDMKYGYFEGEDGSTHYFPSEDAALRAAARRGAEKEEARAVAAAERAAMRWVEGEDEGSETAKRLARRRRMMGRPRSGKSP